jgi:NADH-quinone oxidoreductase subunit J
MNDPLNQLLAQSSVPMAPATILTLCVVAGVGTVFLLPSRREASLRKIGGIVLLAAALIFAALLVRWTAGSASGGMGPYFWIFSAIAIFGALRVVTHTKPVYSALYFVLTVFASAGLFLLLWAEFMAAALILIYAGAILITYVFVIMLAAEASSPGQTGAKSFTDHDLLSRDPVLASAIGFALMGVILFVIFDKYQTVESRGTATQSAAISVASLLQQEDLTSEVFTDPTTQPSIRPSFMESGNEFVGRPGSLSYTFQQPFIQGSTQQLGAFLFTQQLFNLELAGLILTVAMVGAIVIARRQVRLESAADSDMEWEPEIVVGPATPVDDDPHSIPVYGTRNPRQKAYPET